MPENFVPPTPYNALLNAGFSPTVARQALRAVVESGYEPVYRGPKEAYGSTFLVQIFAHSAEHAEKILEASGIDDGPVEIRQGDRVLAVDALNVSGSSPFEPMDWFDHTVDDTVDKLTAETEAHG